MSLKLFFKIAKSYVEDQSLILDLYSEYIEKKYSTSGKHKSINIEKIYDFGEGKGTLYLGNLLSTNPREKKYDGKRDYIIHVLKKKDLQYDLENWSNLTKKPEKELWLEFDDDPNTCILDYLGRAIKFINEGIEKGKNVLVHCWGKVNRSVSVVHAYLKWKFQKQAKDGPAKFDRRIPNEGFKHQLEKWNYNINKPKPCAEYKRKYPKLKKSKRQLLLELLQQQQ